MRVRLANWFRGQPPGAVVVVAADEVSGLRRDGRIAEVLGEDTPSSPESPEQIVSIDGGEESRPSRRRGKSNE